MNRLTALVVAVAALAVITAICANRAGRSPSPQVGPTAKSLTAEPSPSPQAAAVSQPPAELDPVRAVHAYYALLNRRQFAAAYNLLTPALRDSADFSPFVAWVHGFDGVAHAGPTAVAILEQDEEQALVRVEVGAVDWAPPQGAIRQRYAGTWRLVRSNGQWLLDGAQIEELERTVLETAGLPATSDVSGSRVAVLIQGIGSSGSCSDATHFSRQTVLQRALEDAGVHRIPILAFSYSGRYVDCETGSGYDVASLPAQLGNVAPDYGESDTCNGIAAASELLHALVTRFGELGSQVALVGHDLGGLVASYYLSQRDSAFVREHVHSLTLLDSPVEGVGLMDPLSSCPAESAGWQDMSTGSSFVTAINDLARATDKGPFVVIRSSPLGSRLPFALDVQAGCYATDSGGDVAAFLGGIVLPAASPGPIARQAAGYWLDVSVAHECVWFDSVALDTIVETLSR